MTIKFDESFNWLAVLKDLAAGAPIILLEYHELCDMAGDWPTCACGQLCKNLPRDAEGMPLDSWLICYGSEFHAAVLSRRWKLAISLFHRIEARTAELLDA